MCDPVSISLASTAIGLAGTAGTAMAASSAERKQADNVRAWQQKQAQFRKAEMQRQEEFRRGAELERQKGLREIDAEGQQKRQAEEETRLAETLQSDAPPTEGSEGVSEADKALALGRETSGPDLKSDLAKKINDVSKEAKARVAAMARIGSFGESFGGLGTTNPLVQQATGNAIDRQNEFRRGSLAAYNSERAIDPVQVTATASPLAEVFPAMLSMGTQGLGNAYGAGKFGTTVASAAKKATDPWAGMRIGKNSVGLY